MRADRGRLCNRKLDRVRALLEAAPRAATAGRTTRPHYWADKYSVTARIWSGCRFCTTPCIIGELRSCL